MQALLHLPLLLRQLRASRDRKLHHASGEGRWRQSRRLVSVLVLALELQCVRLVLLPLEVLTRLPEQRSRRLRRQVRYSRYAADVPPDLFRDHHDDCGARDLRAALPWQVLRSLLAMLLPTQLPRELRHLLHLAAERRPRAGQSRAW